MNKRIIESAIIEAEKSVYNQHRVGCIIFNKSKIIIGYGAPAKATTALNFFGISKEIDFYR